MSESDDDLLELAGIGSDESDYEPEVSNTRRGGSKRRINDSDLEEEDEDDIEELSSDEELYPLEGKYKDEADKAKLMQMDEISREQILYDRVQEKEKHREKRYFALRAKQSKAESKAIQKGSTSKRLKTSKLSELKRQREKKTSKENRRKAGYDDYDDDDEDDDLRDLAGLGEDDEDDEYYSDDYGVTKRATRSGSNRYEDPYDSAKYKDASYDDINNKIRSTRSVLEKFLYRDEFDECIPGTLIRVNTGVSPVTRRPTYVMAFVEEIVRGGKPYKLNNKQCNTYLKLSRGNSLKTLELTYLSNSPITREEFEEYRKSLNGSNHTFPTVKYVEDKFRELKNMANKQLNDADINRMMAKKEALSVYDMSTAERVRKLGRLREELQVALEQFDKGKAQSIQKQIDQLSDYFQAGNKDKSKLEQINIRNQKSNQEFIRKAEKKLVETKRKQLQNNDFSDPFSRLRTNPKVFYKSDAKAENDSHKEKEKTINEEEEKSKLKNSIFRKEGIDALIKTINIDFQFDI